MAVMNLEKRKGLRKFEYAIPERAPGLGGYPIPDSRHAKGALERAKLFGESGDLKRVVEAVRKRFPYMDVEEYAMELEGGGGDASENQG